MENCKHAKRWWRQATCTLAASLSVVLYAAAETRTAVFHLQRPTEACTFSGPEQSWSSQGRAGALETRIPEPTPQPGSVIPTRTVLPSCCNTWSIRAILSTLDTHVIMFGHVILPYDVGCVLHFGNLSCYDGELRQMSKAKDTSLCMAFQSSRKGRDLQLFMWTLKDSKPGLGHHAHSAYKCNKLCRQQLCNCCCAALAAVVMAHDT
eukprot:354625-Chlamydomonas_euryale.AAC.6